MADGRMYFQGFDGDERVTVEYNEQRGQIRVTFELTEDQGTFDLDVKDEEKIEDITSVRLQGSPAYFRAVAYGILSATEGF